MAASVLALAQAARADDVLPTIESEFPPALRVGSPTTSTCAATVDRIAVELHAEAVSWITIEVTARACGQVVLPLDVPAGTRVVGMAVTTRGERAWSAARPRQAAVDAFRGVRGAALLGWESTSADQDHLRIELDDTARVELAVELPPLATLAIDPAHQTIPRIEARVDGQPEQRWRRHARRIGLDLRALAAHVAEDAYPHADAGTWLVSGAPSRDEPNVSRRFASAPHGPDRLAVRKMMRLNRERITYCYERVAQWQPALAGTVNLRFLIEPDGRVSAAQATSAFPEDINRCLENVLTAWTFLPGDGKTLVNYPLSFSMQ
ncbi:MAG: AgmX/PglI C-terminal domain-containing protein [Myxococcales bacterium]|nr:AgmX/PglI C-terminal domain-containing protein [Myxococcales bacterium]